MMDLGNGFFKVAFRNNGDLDKVLQGGPWFINSNFLTMRLWEPKFQPAKATFSAAAIWIRIPALPLEYYDPVFLEKIGNSRGPLLKIDIATVNGERGKFARICVQVNLMKSLPLFVKVYNLLLDLIYEGISSLCFKCGMVGA